MTTDLVRTTKVQIGLHPSTTDFTSVPATMKFHNLKQAITFDPDYNYEDRSDYQSCANEPQSRLQLAKNVESFPDMLFELRGLDTAVIDGVNASTADFPLAEIFESCFSGILNGGGDTGSATPGTGTTLAMDGATSSGFRGTGLLIETLSGQRLFREIGHATGSSYIIDRALLDADGVAETAAPNAQCWGSRAYNANNQTPNRKHLYIDTENLTYRRTANGVLGTLTLRFPNNGLGEALFSGAGMTGWDAPAVASPSCTTASGGDYIPSYGARCCIDSSLYRAYDVEIELGAEFVPNPTQSTDSGVLGYVVVRTKPMIKFKIPMGTATGVNEATDAFYLGTKENVTYDLSFQFGDEATKCIGVRAPAAALQTKRVEADGMYAMEVEAACTVATESNNCYGTHPLRVHIL